MRRRNGPQDRPAPAPTGKERDPPATEGKGAPNRKGESDRGRGTAISPQGEEENSLPLKVQVLEGRGKELS